MKDHYLNKKVLKFCTRKLLYPSLFIMTIILRLVLEKRSSFSLEIPLDLFKCFHGNTLLASQRFIPNQSTFKIKEVIAPLTTSLKQSGF